MTTEPNSQKDDLSASEHLRFTILHDRVNQEQIFFWQRFTAFSALHAGLFVLVGSKEYGNLGLTSIIGLVLALGWFLAQWASLYYVDRNKGTYYDLCKKVNVPVPAKHWLFRRWLSSTNIGVAVSLVTLMFWIMIVTGIVKI